MTARGVLFAIDEPEVSKLKAFTDEEDLIDYICYELEENYFENHGEWVEEIDKAWDFIHRTLTDGELLYDNGTYPLNHVILGGELLTSGEDYIAVLKTAQQVQEINTTLQAINKGQFRDLYNQIPSDEIGKEDYFDYTWSYFESLKNFWQRVSESHRYILFTVDQ